MQTDSNSLFTIIRKRVSYFLAYAVAALPSAGSAGRILRVTDSLRGLWMDTGALWFRLTGREANVEEFGADRTGVADSTSAFLSAIAALSGNKGVVYAPEGTYKVTSQILFANHYCSIRGDGRQSSILMFTPTAHDVACLKWELGSSASPIYNCGISHLSIRSADSTYRKIAVDLIDVSGFHMHDVEIGGTVLHGGTFYFSGGSNLSIGLRTRGREANTFSKLTITADRPIYLGTNPNAAGLSIDHFHFTDLNLTGNQNPLIEVEDGAGLSNTTFDGQQAWVKGTYGFLWEDTLSASASNSLNFHNVRMEQPEIVGSPPVIGWWFRIALGPGTLQQLKFTNCYGITINEINGLYLRNVNGCVMDNVWYIGDEVALDVDSTCTGFVINGFLPGVGGTISSSGFTDFIYYGAGDRRLGLGTLTAVEYLNIKNNAYIGFRNAADNATIKAIGFNGSNILQVNQAAGVTWIKGTLNIDTEVGGSQRVHVANGQMYGGVNAAGTATIGICSIDGNNRAAIAPSGGEIHLAGKIGMIKSAANLIIDWGSGSPEGVVTAIPGSLWLRTDGGAGTVLYVKESGSSNTGWVAK